MPDNGPTKWRKNIGKNTEKSDPNNDQSLDAGLRDFFTLAGSWGLTSSQQMILLGMPKRALFYKWQSGNMVDIPRNTLMRISYLLGIDKGLAERFGSQEVATAWVSTVLPAFDDRSALDVMLNGQMEDLQNVRQYIESLKHK